MRRTSSDYYSLLRSLSGRGGRGPTKGQVNMMIDLILHPMMKGEDEVRIIALDALAHAIVEQDPDHSRKKFLRYSWPRLVRAIARRQKRSRK